MFPSDYDALGLHAATLRARKVLCLLYHKLSLHSSNTEVSWIDRRNSLIKDFESFSGKEEKMMRMVLGLNSVVQGLKLTINVRYGEF